MTVRHARRQAGAVGRHGGEECRGAGHGQADDRLVRHAGRDRRGEFQADCPMPEVERSFLLPFDRRSDGHRGAQSRFCKAPLQPSAIDLLNPAAGATLGKTPGCWRCARGGNAAAVERYEQEFAAFADARRIRGRAPADACGATSENFTPQIPGDASGWRGGAASCTLKDVGGSDGVVSGSGGGARRLGRLLWLFRTSASAPGVAARCGKRRAGRR